MELHEHQLLKPITTTQSRMVEMAELELQVQPSESASITTNRSLLSLDLLSLSVLGVFVLLYVILFKLTFDSSQMRTGFSSVAKVPCKKCRFYLPNHYLQCAVHPSRALTFNAIDCSDYCSKQNDFHHPYTK